MYIGIGTLIIIIILILILTWPAWRLATGTTDRVRLWAGCAAQRPRVAQGRQPRGAAEQL